MNKLLLLIKLNTIQSKLSSKNWVPDPKSQQLQTQSTYSQPQSQPSTETDLLQNDTKMQQNTIKQYLDVNPKASISSFCI